MSSWGGIDATFVMERDAKRDPFDGMPLGSEWEWGSLVATTKRADPELDARALRERRPCGFYSGRDEDSVWGSSRLRDFIDAEDAEAALAWVTEACSTGVVAAEITVEFDRGPRYIWRYADGVLTRVRGVLDDEPGDD